MNPDGSGVAFSCGRTAYTIEAVIDEDHPFSFTTCCVCEDGFVVSDGPWGGCVPAQGRALSEDSRRQWPCIFPGDSADEAQQRDHIIILRNVYESVDFTTKPIFFLKMSMRYRGKLQDATTCLDTYLNNDGSTCGTGSSLRPERAFNTLVTFGDCCACDGGYRSWF